MGRVRNAALAAITGLVMSLGVAGAMPASATTKALDSVIKCHEWHDSYTYGVKCDSGPAGYPYVEANAVCAGTTLPGAWARVGSGRWSYAYCSAVGSHLISWYYRFHR